jgi:hypothetical protein
MDGELDLSDSRLLTLVVKFRDKQYRDGYVAAHTRGVLARQMRNFRGNLSQADFAEEIGKQKTMIARLENSAYGGWSLRTMLEIARNRGVAIFCRFVDFPTFLKLTNDFSDEALYPVSYDQSAIDQLAAGEEFRDQEQALKALFSPPVDVPSPFDDPFAHPPPQPEQQPLKALDGMRGNNVPRGRAANDDAATDARNSVLDAVS